MTFCPLLESHRADIIKADMLISDEHAFANNQLGVRGGHCVPQPRQIPTKRANLMSIFDKLIGSKSSSGPYQTEAQFETSLARQVSMTRQGLEQLREYEGRELRLEFFFYTNNPANAEALNSKLVDLGYDSRYGESVGDPALFMTTGWTTPIRMDEATVINWIETMCRLGFANDAEFDSNRGAHELANHQ